MSSARTDVVLAAMVLHQQSLEQVWRAFRPLVQSLHLAKESGQLADAGIALGDCSPEPVLGTEAAADLHRYAEDKGVSFGYRPFNANLGHSLGCNELARGAQADVLLFVNPDTYCAPNAIGHLVTALADPWSAAADARQIPCEHPKEYFADTGEQSWASGFFLAVRRSAFEEVDGFDRIFFTYGNDVDLSWRLRLRGYRVVHVPRAVVFHDKRLTERAEVVPTGTELHQGLLARFLLAHKYGRPDVVRELEQRLADTTLPQHRRALNDYHALAAAGSLPKPVKGGSTVADFRDGDYGPRRF
ncbi:MAG TPA: glycosyltransferase family 2 protein [Pseudonocardiaceae bacterium]|nr:glycosyltransferase family 2 protein [Pseudonocardiaceae bacterium]